MTKDPGKDLGTDVAGDNASGEPRSVERRRADRARDDVDWESKVVARLNGRLLDMPASADQPELGWESSVLDVLRKKIERGPA